MGPKPDTTNLWPFYLCLPLQDTSNLREKLLIDSVPAGQQGRAEAEEFVNLEGVCKFPGRQGAQMSLHCRKIAACECAG